MGKSDQADMPYLQDCQKAYYAKTGKADSSLYAVVTV